MYQPGRSYRDKDTTRYPTPVLTLADGESLIILLKLKILQPLIILLHYHSCI
jgi:hypothetical protein